MVKPGRSLDAETTSSILATNNLFRFLQTCEISMIEVHLLRSVYLAFDDRQIGLVREALCSPWPFFLNR